MAAAPAQAAAAPAEKEEEEEEEKKAAQFSDEEAEEEAAPAEEAAAVETGEDWEKIAGERAAENAVLEADVGRLKAEAAASHGCARGALGASSGSRVGQLATIEVRSWPCLPAVFGERERSSERGRDRS